MKAVKRKPTDLSHFKASYFKSGANWTANIKGQCTGCMEVKKIAYIFKAGERLLAIECIDCLSDHF